MGVGQLAWALVASAAVRRSHRATGAEARAVGSAWDSGPAHTGHKEGWSCFLASMGAAWARRWW